jgi:hypothetical protein
MSKLTALFICCLLIVNILTAIALIKERSGDHEPCTCDYCVEAYWEAFRIGHPEFHTPAMRDHVFHKQSLEGS